MIEFVWRWFRERYYRPKVLRLSVQRRDQPGVVVYDIPNTRLWRKVCQKMIRDNFWVHDGVLIPTSEIIFIQADPPPLVRGAGHENIVPIKR